MDNTGKFSSKVEDYVKYRPDYPRDCIEYLQAALGLNSNSLVADIGAGTGIFSRQLAALAGCVYAIEPNRNMRLACERLCSAFPAVRTMDGSAENTGLPDSSVDLITSAQAFHWFDREKCRIEFSRVLKADGRVILVWNSRDAGSELIRQNDALCRKLCPDFSGFSGNYDANREVADFFKAESCDHKVFENDRVLTLDEFIGSSLSASYAPVPADANYRLFVDELRDLFARYSRDGRLRIPMHTYCYSGPLG